MEFWELYDEHRRPLRQTHRRGDPLPAGAFHTIVEIWAVNADSAFLLTQRSPEKEYYPLLWEPVSGSALAGENSLDGAARELFEETGLCAPKEQLSLLASFPDGSSFVDSYLYRLPAGAPADITLQEGETVGARWVALSQLAEMEQAGLLAETCVRRLAKTLPLLQKAAWL